MKVVGAAEIIVWWDAKCNLVSVRTQNLVDGMDWIVVSGVVAAQLA